MKKSIVKYGLISAGILIAINLITFVIFGTDPENYEIGEIVGYATIIGSLILVVFGIRAYDVTQSKSSFMKNMGVGLGISLFPALAFGLYNVIYVKWMDPEFLENYTKYSLEKMKQSMGPEAYEIAKQQTLEEMAMFDNLFFQFFVMFATVFLIGFIISLIAATFFQIKTKK